MMLTKVMTPRTNNMRRLSGGSGHKGRIMGFQGANPLAVGCGMTGHPAWATGPMRTGFAKTQKCALQIP